MDVDNSNIKSKYWLTGSQKFELMNNVSESLAGRVSILEMSSLSFREKKGMKLRAFNPDKLTSVINLKPIDVFDSIYKGGMPEYINDNLDRNQFFNDYLLTYLERDVRNLTQVGDLTRFRKFMIAVASRTGEELNYNSLCEDADIDATTAKRWISILEASDIIYLLKPYFNSELKRVTKTPKIIFMDTGLCSYLCAWNSSENLMNSTVSGHFLETFVISELIKNKRNTINNDNYEIYYYRDRDNKEIDLIIRKDDLIYPFEIKKTAKPDINMISNFKVFDNKKIKIGGGGLICFYENIIPLNNKYKSFPISVIF